MRRSPRRAGRRAARAPAAVLALALLVSACGAAGSERRAGSEVRRGATPSPLVDPNDITFGGVPPDGIPPIDDPKFLTVSEVDFLDAREPVIAIEIEGDARAYPAQIMIWHEIVNDVVGGVPVVVTYCPLCNTGIAFRRPVIDGQLLDFGTSGKLYHSNLVMYDRQTESLWPQAMGQAVIGLLTGMKLDLLPVQMVSWADWGAEHPDGKVLSLDTGAVRPYGENPYEFYDRPDSTPFLFEGRPDPRLHALARVLGVRVAGDALAFPYLELEDRAVAGWGVVQAEVGGQGVVVFWKAGTVSAVDAPVIARSREVGATGAFDPRVGGREHTFRATDGIVDEQTGSTWDIFGRAVSGPLAGTELRPVISTESFWFDWAAFHPNTRIFGLG